MMYKKLIKSYQTKLILLIFISIAFDYFFLIDLSQPPAWDQGYHLSNMFKMHNIISDNNTSFLNKYDSLLNITNSYRGPLTYLISSLATQFTNNSYLGAFLSNHIFNIISIYSIFILGETLKDKRTGIWASIFFSLHQLF